MQTIPLIDIRATGPKTLVETYPEKSRALIHASKNIYGIASRIASNLALPIGDYSSRQWLKRTHNPYYDEICYYANHLNMRGVYALNLCYEWGCTSGVYVGDTSVTLSRVLDWPFPALGEHMVVAQQSGSAGDFYNVTWPGVAGVFNAMAPQRFSAALNQAPMRRYKSNMVVDWIRNRLAVGRNNSLPPAHLLRMVFEQAQNYEQAKDMLCTTPVAIPVIYILAGTTTNEGCVIERLENSYAVRELHHGNVCAANHFESHLNGIGRGWSLRGVDSEGRSRAASHCSAHVIARDFTWFQEPIANRYSRLVMVIDAAQSTLSLMGTEGIKPVTEVFQLGNAYAS
jgi:hypothetical protein